MESKLVSHFSRPTRLATWTLGAAAALAALTPTPVGATSPSTV